MRTQNKKGFTLAELLIVVAILGVLVAVAIPVFTTSLEKAKKAVDDANLRSAQAVASVLTLTGEVEVEGLGKVTKNTIISAKDKALYLLKDGSFALASKSFAPENAYRSQVKHEGMPVGSVIQIIAVTTGVGSEGPIKAGWNFESTLAP